MRLVVNALMMSALAGALLVPGVARAQDVGMGIGGFYVGGALAYTEADRSGDESGIGTYMYGGLDFFRIPAVVRLGAEVGHIRSRKIERGGAAGDKRIANTGVSAMGTLTSLPLIDLHARIGYEDGDTSGVFQALGATLKPAPMLGVRAEYAWHNGFDAWTVGVRLRFR